jgi:glucose-6-phosphate dehydrogenase assembly protein OpcA
MSTASAPSPEPFIPASIPVDLADAEAALMRIWKHEQVIPGTGQGVLTRACMSNLIIVCEGKEAAEAVAREVDEIVSRHPSRVLLLVSDPEGPGRHVPVSASVSARCHVRGDKRQVCSGMVTITAGGDEDRKLPSAARELLVGDLPTSLWWDRPEPPPLASELFDELEPMADQVIYSSLQWDDPVRGTLAAADWVEQGRPGDPVAIDLAWRHLRPWRQLISQSLDPTALPGALGGLDRVEIEHGPRGLPQAWLLAGWLADALHWKATERTLVKGREIAWRFRAERGEVGLVVRRVGDAEPQVSAVRVAWRGADGPAEMAFAPAGSGILAATARGVNVETRVLPAPALTRARLVSAELAELHADPVFRKALRVSRKLAENLDLR